MTFPNSTKLALTAVASSMVAGVASAAVVPLDFTNISMVSGSTTTYSSAGDAWVATDVRLDAGPALDAVFTITSTDDGSASALPTSTVFFDTSAARGNNMRVRVGGDPSNRVADAFVFLTVEFFNSGTSTPYTGWAPGEELITQFSDLDSDAGFDRTDFGGVHNADFTDQFTSDDVIPGTSLLITDGTTFTDYSVAYLDTPWGPEGNVTSTNPVPQSPVSTAFTRDAQNSIRMVVGQLSNGPAANRHIDIDMTPDFDIVPEPSSFALLAGIAGLGMALSARRRRQ